MKTDHVIALLKLMDYLNSIKFRYVESLRAPCYEDIKELSILFDGLSCPALDPDVICRGEVEALATNLNEAIKPVLSAFKDSLLKKIAGHIGEVKP